MYVQNVGLQNPSPGACLPGLPELKLLQYPPSAVIWYSFA